MRLHLKTTLLVSTIAFVALTALLLLFGARLVQELRGQEKQQAEVAAVGLARQYNYSSTPAAELATAFVPGPHPEHLNILVWKWSGDKFSLEITPALPDQEMPSEVVASLRTQQIARLAGDFTTPHDNVNYRVFAPFTQAGQVVGAIEVSAHLETLPTLLRRWLGTVLLGLLLAVGLIAITTHVLVRRLLYYPLQQLLAVIALAKTGALQVPPSPQRTDEIGKLAQEFHCLLGQLHTMARERAEQQEQLRERVRAATARLQEHNEQLETTNLELWRTTRRLTQLERLAAAGQTAAQFAHEVGTPLNLISCHAQLMQTELASNPANLPERMSIILEQTERIERIVRQMMSRTRAEPVAFIPLDLNALLKHIVDATAPTFLARGVTFALSLALSLPPIEGDAEKLQQVFLNLIHNALDAMTEGGQLTITTRRETAPGPANAASHVVVTFVDTGCGMTPEVRAHLFDPLYTRKTRSNGTGFGLVIAHQVMQEHQAQISVESVPHQGARFTLLFSALTAVSAKGQPA